MRLERAVRWKRCWLLDERFRKAVKGSVSPCLPPWGHCENCTSPSTKMINARTSMKWRGKHWRPLEGQELRLLPRWFRWDRSVHQKYSHYWNDFRQTARKLIIATLEVKEHKEWDDFHSFIHRSYLFSSAQQFLQGDVDSERFEIFFSLPECLCISASVWFQFLHEHETQRNAWPSDIHTIHLWSDA